MATAATLSRVPAAFAASTWFGNDYTTPGVSNISMANPANWSGGTPVSGTTLDLIFTVASGYTTTPNQNIANPLLLRTLDATNAYNWTFSGNTYRFANATANFLSTGGSNTFNTTFDFAGPTTVTNSGSTLTGLLSGSGALLISNTSFNVSPVANNTYNGAIVCNNGAIVVGGSGTALASPSYTLIDGSYINITGNNRLAGSPSLTLNTTGAAIPSLYSNGSQSFGAVTINSNSSSVQVVGGVTLNGNVAFNASAAGIYSSSGIALNANVTVSGGSGTLSGSQVNLGGASRTFNIVNASDTFAADSMSNGALVKTGAGTLSLGYAPSTFSAPINLQAGKIIAGPDHLGQGVTNNGILDISYTPGSLVAGAITGPGSVIIDSGCTYGVLNSYSGGTTINSAQLTGSTATLNGNIVGTSLGSTLEINQPAGSGTLSAVYSGPGGLSKTGTGRAVIGGTNAYTNSTGIYDGTLAVASDTAIGTGPLTWAANIEAVGTRTLSNSLTGTVGLGNAGVVGSGNLTFTDAAAKVSQATFTYASTGTTTIPGKLTLLAGASMTVNAGTFILGDPAAVNGFVSAVGSTIAANSGGSLKLQAANFISLPDVTLNGGNLIVPNGYAIPLAAVLQGSGSVAGRVSSANGSTISAAGNLLIGDGANAAGVNLDGELYTHQYAVTLNDSNQGVVGSITNLGNGPGVPGTLNAANGLVVNFGRNITGNGTINSTNTLATAIIMNGDVSGDSITDYLNFTGYVKGVGTFNNVAFSGTYAPGLSPILATVGSVIFTPSNVLDMEIGGTTRGTQYDGINATGNLGLGGQLKLSLINAFTPSLGNQFNLFDGPMTGTFSSFNFAPLPAGLQWDTSLLYSQGIVQVVVPEPTTIAGTMFAGFLLRRRR